MKEKDIYTNLSERQTDKDENNLRRYLLYSAGEDFYSIFQEEKDSDAENKTKNPEINWNFKFWTGPGFLFKPLSIKRLKNKWRTKPKMCEWCNTFQ